MFVELLTSCHRLLIPICSDAGPRAVVAWTNIGAEYTPEYVCVEDETQSADELRGALLTCDLSNCYIRAVDYKPDNGCREQYEQECACIAV